MQYFINIKKQLALAAVMLLTVLQPVKAAKGFAIIIDSKSLGEAKTEVEAYAKAIEDVNKLKVYIITDRWGVPDSIRACLHDMYRHGKIEGTVFVGDIPVPMIRDAQHLTSAFKMSQKAPRKDSSVPSDRYYDDFGLTFDNLGHDEGTPLFYYSLRPDCDQHIHCDIYSGRIRPTDCGGTSRYDKLRRYLRKVVTEKRTAGKLDHMLYFTGQGSLNESRVAAIDEKIEYYEHFPWMRRQADEGIRYLDFSQAPYIKVQLMNELQRPELDLSILHHHGDFDTQYLNKANKKVPDSIDVQMRDLHLPDFAAYGFAPNSRIVIFDACYNGAFQNDDCIANEYIFTSGKTVACMAGTVNLLQDKWYDKLIGLLGFGHTIGEINCYQEYLESHIIGDPTFTFAPESGFKESETADGQALKMYKDFEKGKISSSRLLSLLKSSPYDQVRLQALTLLSRLNNDDFVKGIKVAAHDRYEMTQRFAMNYIRLNGSETLAKPLLEIYMDENSSARVRSDAMRGIEFFTKETLEKAYNEIVPTLNIVAKDSLTGVFHKYITRHADYWRSMVDELLSDTLSEKNFNFNASCMKLYCAAHSVPDILGLIRRDTCDAHRVELMEAMGWYNNSCQSQRIAEFAKEISQDASASAALRKEALKTYNRVRPPKAAK